MLNELFNVSFRCYYPDNAEPCQKFQQIALRDIPRWLDAYKFTHPNCKSIAVKIWFADVEKDCE